MTLTVTGTDVSTSHRNSMFKMTGVTQSTCYMISGFHMVYDLKTQETISNSS